MQFLLRWVLIVQFLIFQSSFANAKGLLSNYDLLEEAQFSQYLKGNEFMSGQEPGVVMMKVNLWGAVIKPGIHHIPVKTDLIKLLSYAGGPTSKAKMHKLLIKRRVADKEKHIKVDLQKLLHGEKTFDLSLQPDDVIVIPSKQPILSNDMLILAGFTATLLTSILTATLIEKSKD